MFHSAASVRTLLLATIASAPALAQSVTGTARAATQVIVTAGPNTDSRPAGTDLTGGFTLNASYQQPISTVTANASFAVTNNGGAVVYTINESVAGSIFTRRSGPHSTLLTLASPLPVTGTLTVQYSAGASGSGVTAEVDVGNDGSVEWSIGQQNWQQQIFLSGPLDIRTNTSLDINSHSLRLEFTPDPFPQLPLFNPGFENGLNGWQTFGNAFAEPADPPEVEPRNGTGVCKMFGNFNAHFDVTGIFQTFAASPGETYAIDCWGRHWSGDPLVGTGSPSSNWATKKIAFFDATGNEIGAAEATVLDGTSPTDTWIRTPSLTATAPPGTAAVQALLLFLQPGTDPGAVQFDDVAFGLSHEMPLTIQSGAASYTQSALPTDETNHGTDDALDGGLGDNLERHWWWYRIVGGSREHTFKDDGRRRVEANGTRIHTHWSNLDNRDLSATLIQELVPTSTGGARLVETMTLFVHLPIVLNVELFCYTQFRGANNEVRGGQSSLVFVENTLIQAQGPSGEILAQGNSGAAVDSQAVLYPELLDAGVDDFTGWTGQYSGPPPAGVLQWSVQAPYYTNVSVYAELVALGCQPSAQFSPTEPNGIGSYGEPIISGDFPVLRAASSATNINLSSAKPNALAVLQLNIASGSANLSGIYLKVEQVGAVNIFAVTDSNGAASYPLDLPGAPGLCGLPLYGQWIIADPTGPTNLATFTGRATLRVGSW